MLIYVHVQLIYLIITLEIWFLVLDLLGVMLRRRGCMVVSGEQYLGLLLFITDRLYRAQVVVHLLI